MSAPAVGLMAAPSRLGQYVSMPSSRTPSSAMPLPSQREPAERIIIQCIHVELTPAMHRTIVDKFATLIRHDPNIIRINIRLHKDQKLGLDYHYSAMAQIEVSGPDIVAHADGQDAYAALDQLVDKLDQLLERRHDRRKSRRNHPHAVELPGNLPKADKP
jgi:putative sigma-54 modulation protein